ncbi:hypothetical protein NQ318_000260 [Aromia moschata]|uniref:DUF5641 domain-containing protein n=1 Tax=Aromia moschata TaxID=1265417 RepID=A0AAV8YX14_9CUCU|nr:hypothetical protein NQ318_000260 [Aromia moschata]
MYHAVLITPEQQRLENRNLADENAEKYPKLANSIRSDFYVDDLLNGADNLEETANICADRLWLEKTTWDETVPPHIQACWRDFRREIPVLNELMIDRRVTCDETIRAEMHGFSDASENEYGGCIYVRSLVKEDNQPPVMWKLGRVEAIHPGKDGIAKVATLRTSGGIIKRSFAKICPLPLESP